MPTIKDIAKLAGVSHGTVSNVLNGRGNVSVEKIEAVQRAAKEVGYQLNAQAQSLRASKSQGVALLLPDINAEQYYQLYRGLHQVCQPSLSEPLDLYLTNDLPSLELEILQTLAAKSYQTIVTVSCLSNSQPYYEMLKLPAEQILLRTGNLPELTTISASITSLRVNTLREERSRSGRAISVSSANHLNMLIAHVLFRRYRRPAGQ
ncbi:putative LacI family regulatory protein [Klebsiella michiganensis]|nr:putative LacI family regulatory protein [Klebsiella michiganensis]